MSVATPRLRRGLAFIAGIGIAAIPSVGPFLAILTIFTGQFAVQRADFWWLTSAGLLSLPYLVAGHPVAALQTVLQIAAVWLIYRSAAKFRGGVRSRTISDDLGAGLIVGLGVTLAFGLRQLGDFRFDVAKTALDAITWNTHPAVFGHAILVMAALLALVVPSPRLRVIALGLGAAGVIISGAREAVWAWLVIAIGLQFVGRRGGRGTKIASWVLTSIMALLVTGLATQLGLGRTGFLTDYVSPSDNPNLFRGTEVANGDWWFPLGVTFTSHHETIDGNERSVIDVTKISSEPWSRLQQAVTLNPGETYTLSALLKATPGATPGFDSWGQDGQHGATVTVGTVLEGTSHRVNSAAEVKVISTSSEAVDEDWVRAIVTFEYTGANALTWYVGVVPDRSVLTGVTASFAELQLVQSYASTLYRPGAAVRGVTDLSQSRLPIWQDAITAIQAKPLLGWGPAGFPRAVAAAHADEPILRPVAAHAHNAFLATWVDRGIVGLVGLLGLIGLLFLRAIQQRDTAALVVLAGIIVLNLFDSTIFSGAVIYPSAAVLGWRAAGHRQVATHETGSGTNLFTRVALAATDWVMAVTAFATAYFLVRPAPTAATGNDELLIVPYLALLWPLANALAGQYPAYGRPSWAEFQWSFSGAVAAGGFALLISAAFPGQIRVPVAVALLATVITCIMNPLGRAIAKRTLYTLCVWGRPVVMVGHQGSADQLALSLLAQPLLGLRPVAIVDAEPKTSMDPALAAIAHKDLSPGVEAMSNHCIVQPGQQPSALPLRVLSAAGRDTFRYIQVVPDLHDVPSSDVVARPLGMALSLQVQNNLASPTNRAFKRTFDIAAVLLGGLLAAPLVAFLAVAIRLDSPGPAFFKQRRIGRDGVPFFVWKFRSMVADAPERLKSMLESDAEARMEWEATQKLVNDPRITRVGRLLRKTSLDELPQLWNVLRGEMSLVGPRPIVDDEIPKYGDQFHYYIQVRPGMTGAWQVSGRSDTSYDYRVALDTYYVRNWSGWIDIDILVKTAAVVLKREGAY